MSLLTRLTRLADPRIEAPPTPPFVANDRAIAVVLDDDPGMRSLMTMALEQCGYVVIAVPNGLDAVQQVGRVGRVDLIVADLDLHDGRAPRAVNTLRALTGYVPVVYVSDRQENAVGVADPVIRKPFRCGEWLNVVASVVGVLPKDKLLAA